MIKLDSTAVIVYLLTNALIAFAIVRIMNAFFESKHKPYPIIILSYSLYYVLSSLAFLFFNIPFVSMLVSVLTVFVISLNYKSSMVKKVVVSICICCLFIIAEIIAVLFAGILFYDVLADAEIHQISGFIIAGLLSYFFALLLGTFSNLKRNFIAPFMFWVSILIIPGSTLFIVISVLSSDLSYITRISIIALMFGINLFTFYLHNSLVTSYEDKLKSMLHAKESEYYSSQCKLMYESVDKIKSFRHDIKIHLGALKALAVDSSSDEVLGYINRLIVDIKSSEIYCDSGNIVFDSIINFKLGNTAESDVKLSIDISVPPAVNIDTFDLVTILGNLMDNALDAVAKVKEKWICLDIKFNKGLLTIHVENSFDGEVKYLDGETGKENSIISRKQGDTHGYGLKNVRKSVASYNGSMAIVPAKGSFSVNILLCTNR